MYKDKDMHSFNTLAQCKAYILKAISIKIPHIKQRLFNLIYYIE